MARPLHHNESLARFGTAVRLLRRRQGISQEELAGRAGLHRTYVTDVERGARNVTLNSIAKVATALKVPLAELFAAAEGGVADAPVAVYRGGAVKPVEILLVEDNPQHAEVTAIALEKNGVANPVLSVGTGEEALELLTGGGRFAHRAAVPPPGIMLLDLTLPGMSGLDLLRSIRDLPAVRAIPVIVLTSSRSDQDYKESMALGVRAYISKPVDFLEFSTVIPSLGFRWQLLDRV
jgi:CheY-like chemotaxis protein/DNA-binding XRE family transcriptional regulator